MKIAYLITAYNNPRHLKKLVAAIHSPNSDIFIHIDKKSKTTFVLPKYKNVYVLENTIKVYWGSFTFIKALLLLIEKSFTVNTYDYYILLSGACYPIRSNAYIEKFIKRNLKKEFINIVKMPENGKSFDRTDYFYMSIYDKSFNIFFIFKRIINFLIRALNLKRNYPKQYKELTLYGGSTWWALSGECIRYIETYIKKNPTLVAFYTNTLIPEETFFHTIVGNSKFMKHVENTLTYTDWPTNDLAHPVDISEKHIEKLIKKNISSTDGKQKEILYARKFSDKSEQVIKIIDTFIKK